MRCTVIMVPFLQSFSFSFKFLAEQLFGFHLSPDAPRPKTEFEVEIEVLKLDLGGAELGQ